MRELSIPTLASSYRGGLMVRRCLASCIDFVVVFLLASAAAPLYVEQPVAVIVLAIAAIWIGYHACLEACLGVTIGKWLAGIRVTTETGDFPGFRRAALRSVLRLVEVNPILLARTPRGDRRRSVGVQAADRRQARGYLRREVPRPAALAAVAPHLARAGPEGELPRAAGLRREGRSLGRRSDAAGRPGRAFDS